MASNNLPAKEICSVLILHKSLRKRNIMFATILHTSHLLVTGYVYTGYTGNSSDNSCIISFITLSEFHIGLAISCIHFTDIFLTFFTCGFV